MFKLLAASVLFTILGSTAAFAAGTSYKVSAPQITEKRIDGVLWKLVKSAHDDKDGEFYEVWEDTSTGLYWGDRTPHTYDFDHAVMMKYGGTEVENDTVCKFSEDAKWANAGITDKTFGLPKPAEVQQAFKDGMGQVLPHARDLFWAASLEMGNWQRAKVYWPESGLASVSEERRNSNIFVRCVGR